MALRHIQEILGHRSIKTTVIYTHLTPKTHDILTASINFITADL